MSTWRDDPRIPYAIAAFLGMVAGVAAKQAVAIQSGEYPRPLSLLADVMVLGMIFLMTMYLHQWKPNIPMEGIALFSAAMAMWGPKGLAALLTRWQSGALTAAEHLARQMLRPVEPVHRPTDLAGLDRDREMSVADENKFGQLAPGRKMRDIIPLKSEIPADMGNLLAEADKVDPLNGDDHPPATDKGGQND